MNSPPSPSKEPNRQGARQQRTNLVRCQICAFVFIVLALMTTLMMVRNDGGNVPRHMLAEVEPDHQVRRKVNFMMDPSEVEPLEFVDSMKPLHIPKGRKANKAKVDLSVKQPGKNFGRLKKMWSCHDKKALEGRPKKLVFVHVFKTAGSTMRSLLQAYAHTCNAGIAIVTGCTAVSSRSLESGTWENGSGRRSGNKCVLKRAQTRDLVVTDNVKSMNTTFLKENVDILAGHLPLGSDEYWNNDDGEHVDVQYMTFFRDSVHKYVSGVLFKNPNLSLEDIVSMIKERVSTERVYGKYYERYSSYLITPQQRSEFDKIGVELSHDQAANVAMSNLVTNNVLIGVVERMSESLEMLKYVVDRQGDLSSMFEFFGMEDMKGQRKKYFANKSKLSTSEVVAELEKDPDFMVKLREYVKYDEKVRLFALDLHMRQYQWLQEHRVEEDLQRH